MFDAFDAPDTQTACPQRTVSTHALQALVLLNSDFAADRARALAGRLFREVGRPVDARVAPRLRDRPGREPRARRRSTRPAPSSTSQADAAPRRPRPGQPLARPTFVPDGTDPAEAAAWVDFALAMLNRNEFVYVP